MKSTTQIQLIGSSIADLDSNNNSILQGKDVYTFWSLEDLYPNNRFRYHLGQFSMIEKMKYLLSQGHNVHAVVCDADHITMRSDKSSQWQHVINQWSSFIRTNISGDIQVSRVSELMLRTRSINTAAATEFNSIITSDIELFRSIILKYTLGNKEKRELKKFREYMPIYDSEKLPKEMLSDLSSVFSVDEYLLFASAYAFIHRPAWFSSGWLSDFIYFLANEKSQDKVILEANRNAYAWLFQKCFFEIAKQKMLQKQQRVLNTWPSMVFVESLLSLNGKSAMGVFEPEHCIFIDSTDSQLKNNVNKIHIDTALSLNKNFFGNQQEIDVSSSKWRDQLFERIIGYRNDNLNFVRYSTLNPLPMESQFKTDIAIITILPEEYEAVRKILDNTMPYRPSGDKVNIHSWVLSTVLCEFTGNEYKIVVAKSGKPGITAATNATTNTLEEFRPRYLIVCGIAGGFPKEKLKKGDIIISTNIWNYDYGKIEENYKPRIRFIHEADLALLNASTTISNQEEWKEGFVHKPNWIQRKPKAVAGIVASGNKIIDNINDDFVQSCLAKVPELVGVEMEGAGVADAIENYKIKGNAVGYIMIRGVSDMTNDYTSGSQGTSKRNRDVLKQYASELAAKFVVQMIKKAWPVVPINSE